MRPQSHELAQTAAIRKLGVVLGVVHVSEGSLATWGTRAMVSTYVVCGATAWAGAGGVVRV